MKKTKNLGMLLVVFLILVTGTKTVFGSTNLINQKVIVTELQIDTITPQAPIRIVYDKEKGIFLTERQEEIILEKLQWKEIYRTDAVTMYWVNLALQDRINDLELQKKNYRSELLTCESQIANAAGVAEHYKLLYTQEKQITTALNTEVKGLKIENTLLKIGMVSVTIAGVVYIIYSSVN